MDLPKLELFAACFRFVQITERSYEASHSIVKRRVPPNAAGPIVSLSLRLRDFSQAVQLQESVLQEVADEFSTARHVRKIPGLIGLAAHPELVRYRKQKWSLLKALNKVVYRSDIQGQFPEVAHVDVSDKKRKQKLKQATQKLTAGNEMLPLTYENLRAAALHGHFLALAEACPGLMFAMPAKLLGGEDRPLLNSVNARLAASSQLEGAAAFSSDVAHSVHAESLFSSFQGGRSHEHSHADSREQVFFKVLHSQPSRRKVISLSPAAAGQRGRLHAKDVAVSVHEHLPALGPEAETEVSWLSLVPVVREGGSSAQVLANLPHFMTYKSMSQNLVCSVSKFQSRDLKKGHGELLYSFFLPASVQDKLEAFQCSNEQVARVATGLVRSNAYPGSDSWLSILASDELALLCEAGFISQRGHAHGSGNEHEHSYQLSHQGLSELRMYASFADFAPVAQQRHDALQLPSPSTHELLQLLEEESWVWQRLPQKRKREGHGHMLAYEIGRSEKVFHTSGLTVASECLKCLLSSQDLQLRYGIQRIPHGRPLACYVDLLEGKVPADVPLPPPRLALEFDLSQRGVPADQCEAIALEAPAEPAANSLQRSPDDAAFLDEPGKEDADDAASST